MHGEHRVKVPSSSVMPGSSPYARGARHGKGDELPDSRIIPVCTGSTARPRRPRAVQPDHPRMHGEHVKIKGSFAGVVGSSPYARGAHRSEGRKSYPQGIIPVCTGSTCFFRRSDHFGGIIPVCTGSTARNSGQSPSPRDHPRMHGEHKGFSP